MDNINRAGFDISKLIEFRHWMHQNAELSLAEFNTMQKIKEYGISVGLPAESFVVSGKTGWMVDVQGKGPAKGSPRTIGVRSDHDALPIAEKNFDLPYISKTNAAHMCGHDGHTAMLLGGLTLLMNNLEKIPSDRRVRFIFQPAEEGELGAEAMIKDGVLEGVDEVYGCHNVPMKHNMNEILVNDTEMMANIQKVVINVVGKGGHGSAPEKCNNPIIIAARAYLEIIRRLTDYKENKSGRVRFSLTSFNGGSAFNVIPDSVEILGSMRDFSAEDEKAMGDIVREVLDEITQETKSTYTLKISKAAAGPVVNHPKYADYVRKAAKLHYGEDKVSDEGTPIYASEDFSDFLMLRPGCFFFRVIRNNHETTTLHSDRYNFDDSVIEDTSFFWYRLMYDRLNAE